MPSKYERERPEQSGTFFAVGGNTVKNPLDSIWGTVISGFVLTLILYFIAQALLSHAGAPAGA